MIRCRYRDVLGRPGEGVHRARVFSMAAADILMTLIAAFLFSFCFFPIHQWRNFFVMFILLSIFLFSAGIILHRAFCVRTTVDRWLFPRV